MNGTRRAVVAALGASMAALGGCAATRGLGVGSSDGISVESAQFSASEDGCTERPDQSATVALDGSTATIDGTIPLPDTCTPLAYDVFTAHRAGNRHVIVEIRASETGDPLGPCEDCPSERHYEARLTFDGPPTRVSVVHSPPDRRSVLAATSGPPD